MRIAIIGPGGIGSTFAFHLSRAGHDVTVVARRARLERLRHDGAIVTKTGERAPVQVADQLDVTEAWDLVLVTVLASEVDVLLPALAECAARAVMFMFNTFRPLDRFRDAVGAERVVFGFPSIGASVKDGTLSANVLGKRMPSVVSDRRWADVFSAAGIPSAARPDMQGWLRTHAAISLTLMLTARGVERDGRGLRGTEAADLARALREGMLLVRRLGDKPTPGALGVVGGLPVPVLAGLLWTLSRLPAFVRMMSVAPPDEPAALIDEMRAVAPGDTRALLAVRPE